MLVLKMKQQNSYIFPKTPLIISVEKTEEEEEQEGEKKPHHKKTRMRRRNFAHTALSRNQFSAEKVYREMYHIKVLYFLVPSAIMCF